MDTSIIRMCGQRISRSSTVSRQSAKGSCSWLRTVSYSRALRLSSFFFLLGTIAGSATAQEKPSPTLLKVGISHSEVLPPLPPNQQAGQFFDGFDMQANPSEKAQPVAPPFKQTAQQAGKTTNVPVLPYRIPARWQTNTNSAAVPPQKSAAKAIRTKPSVPTKSGPSQAEIEAAVRLRNQYNGHQQFSQSQSSMLQAGANARGGLSVHGQSTNTINGSVSRGQPSSGRQKNGTGVTSVTQRRFKIPAWLAGVWQRSDENELSRVQLPSGKQLKPSGVTVARVKDTFGTYRDQSGQIWQVFDPRRASGSIDRGADIDYHSITAYDIIENGSDAPVVSVRATHVIVSKSTHRVVDSYQDEELNTYSKTPDGRLRTDSSVKVFDAKGKPRLLTTALSMEVMTAPFSGPVIRTTK